jgi:hypothetical protein
MNDLVVKSLEKDAVFLIMQRFGFVGMGFRGFHPYKFVNHVPQFVQTQFQQFQFVKKSKAIVDHKHPRSFGFHLPVSWPGKRQRV